MKSSVGVIGGNLLDLQDVCMLLLKPLGNFLLIAPFSYKLKITFEGKFTPIQFNTLG